LLRFLASRSGSSVIIPSSGREILTMAKNMTKSAFIEAVTNKLGDGVPKKQVSTVLETMIEVAHKELKKSGSFVLPGFAKFVVVKKPATKERQGINPFTKEPITIAAKPASKKVRARPVKAIKDVVG
jgi:nucleoid DNA-binding protein